MCTYGRRVGAERSKVLARVLRVCITIRDRDWLEADACTPSVVRLSATASAGFLCCLLCLCYVLYFGFAVGLTEHVRW